MKNTYLKYLIMIILILTLQGCAKDDLENNSILKDCIETEGFELRDNNIMTDNESLYSEALTKEV